MAFPGDEVPITVEAFLGEWVDLTAAQDVLVRDGIAVGRGRPDWHSRVSPSTLGFTLNNAAGKYSPKNPLSPYYGLIGRNTPVRVSVGRTTDDFDRTLSDSWGTFPTGDTWTVLTGAATSFDVTGSAATITTSGSSPRVIAAGNYGDADVLARVKIDSRAGLPDFGLVGKAADASNYQILMVRVLTSDVLAARKVIGGISYAVGSQVELPADVVVDTWYWLRASFGKRMRAKIWADGDTEPDWQIDVYDTDFDQVGTTTSGGIGAYAAFPVVYTIDSIRVDQWRYHGEIAALPPKWDVSENDLWIPVTAAGWTRRWSRTQAVLQSTFRLEALQEDNLAVTTGYWPVEDESDATQIASGLAGGQSMRIVGDLNFAADDTAFPGSAPLLRLGATGIGPGIIPAYAGTGTIAFRALVGFPASLTDLTVIAELWQATGTVQRWRLTYHTGGAISLRAIGAGGTVLADSGSIAFAVNSKNLMLGFTVVQNGANVDWAVFGRYVADLQVFELGLGGTFNSMTVTTARHLYVAPNRDMSDVVCGHFLVGNSDSLASGITDAIIGYRGETAADRIERLCLQRGIRCQIIGDPTESAACGPQRIASVPELIYDAVDADRGILYEPRDDTGIAYRTRVSLYNQQAVAQFTFSAGEVAPPMEPVDDDQHIANDLTATRAGGSSARSVVTSGPLNTSDPMDDPQGVGVYDRQITVHVATDDMIADVASEATYLGTRDDTRYALVKVNHARLALDAKPALSAAAAAIDIGDRFVVDGLPVSVPAEDASVLAEGYVEVFTPHGWTQDFNTSPGGPFTVAEVSNTDAQHGFDPRVAGDGDMVLAAPADSDDTTLLVTSASGDQRWCTPTDDAESADDFPMDAVVGGERVTVTDVDPGLLDAFGRSVSSSWGSPDSSYPGTGYSLSGTAADFSTTGSVGRIATATTASLYLAHVDIGATDAEWFGQVTVPVLPTGAPISLWACARLTDASNYYVCHVEIATTGVVTLSAGKRVAGSFSGLGSLTLAETHSAGNTWRLGIKTAGSTIWAKAWKTSRAEPGWQVRATDTALTAGTRIGAGVRRETGNTNGTQNIDWDDFTAPVPQILTVTRSVNGIVKAHAAGDVIEVFEPAHVAR